MIPGAVIVKRGLYKMGVIVEYKVDHDLLVLVEGSVYGVLINFYSIDKDTIHTIGSRLAGYLEENHPEPIYVESLLFSSRGKAGVASLIVTFDEYVKSSVGHKIHGELGEAFKGLEVEGVTLVGLPS